ncbi:MAG: tetratricopeptide repeat protein [Bacteroidia bacterium]|nr:tetratricopeptide repeat protein [Bacteroidia bacterium]
MLHRYFAFTILALIVLPSFVFSQKNISTSKLGIHEFIFVDEEAYPTNLEKIKTQIGYPVDAMKAKVEGKVMCRILIDAKGSYQEHRITQIGHPLLADAVEPHLSNLNFVPARVDGQQVAYWLNVLFEFDLREHPHKGLNKKSKQRYTTAFAGSLRKADKYLSQAKSSYTAQNFVQARRMAWSSIHSNPFKRKKTSISKERLMEAWEIYGKTEFKLGNIESAVNAFTEAIAIGEEISTQMTHTQSTLLNLYLYRGQAKIEGAMLESASNDLYWVLTTSKNPQPQSKALFLRSVLYTRLKQYEEALNDAEKALELNPYYFQAAWQKAELLSLIGAKQEACNILHAYPPVYEAEKQKWKRIAEESCITDAAKN